MTYARCRLYLGITSVGTLVLLCVTILIAQHFDYWPTVELLNNESLSFISTFGIVGGLIATAFTVMLPFDLLGGYWLPVRYERSTSGFASWFSNYLWPLSWQLTLYTCVGTCLIFSYRFMGMGGVAVFTVFSMAVAISFRNSRFANSTCLTALEDHKLARVNKLLREINFGDHDIVVVDRKDIGFTGGIIGLPSREKIVILRKWLDFKPEALMTILARRILAIRSGDYFRGLLGAFAWNLAGLIFATFLSSEGVGHVNGLIQLMCWFTLFSFFGLLVMPTLSRIASKRLDRMLMVVGINKRLLKEAAKSMDQLQDDEPIRTGLVETIFHPIPSVENRVEKVEHSTYGMWQIARTILFTSWGCLGLLARAVHCNVGRPDLWLMPPSD